MRLSCLPVSFFGAISQAQMSVAEWMDFADRVGVGRCGVRAAARQAPRGPSPQLNFGFWPKGAVWPSATTPATLISPTLTRRCGNANWWLCSKAWRSPRR